MRVVVSDPLLHPCCHTLHRSLTRYPVTCRCSKYAEIVGTVNADLSITETRAVPFGESFGATRPALLLYRADITNSVVVLADMASYNQLVGHIHGKFKDLFM